jgi:phage gp46-like protein
MKSKQFGSGNLLRDLFQQSQLHGVEFRNLVCKHFGWSADQFKQQTTGSRLFTRNDAFNILSVKFDAIGSQLKYAKKCMESVYISSEK